MNDRAIVFATAHQTGARRRMPSTSFSTAGLTFAARKSRNVTVRQFLESQFNCDSDFCTMQIIDCQVVKKTAYAALAWLMKDTGRDQVIGIVCMLQSRPEDSADILCWTEMSESMLPPAFDCPLRILRLLTSTDDINALRWRAACRKQCSSRRYSCLPRRCTTARTCERRNFLHPLRGNIGAITQGQASPFSSSRPKSRRIGSSFQWLPSGHIFRKAERSTPQKIR